MNEVYIRKIMFTGIIEDVVEVKSICKIKDTNKKADVKLTISLGKISRGMKVGDSMSINGACLTIAKLSKGTADFEIVDETIKRTCLGLVKSGDKVNIERSLRLRDRLEGHIVLGHVDCTGIIDKIITTQIGTHMWIRIEDKDFSGSFVSKGSVAIDGISLTIVNAKDDRISIALIPHTLTSTTLGSKSKGNRVNIEIDIISRYVNSLLLKK
ncbi:MAG TPA: riboflavin synthase [Nitrososphaeraceae archaeon]|nr:riboflavin synthase [Nitrososphaeraceae archaeon]